MSVAEVDDYIGALPEPVRATLEEVRRAILEVVPDAEQVISYRVPAFRVRGATVAGFAAFKNHISYLPFSGSVLPALQAQLKGYSGTKSALHFQADQPLPRALVSLLVETRMSQAGLGPPSAS